LWNLSQVDDRNESGRAGARVTRSADDILAIQDVVVRYGYLIDDRDWAAIDLVFTDDAVIDYRNQEVQPPRGLAPLIGRDEILRHFRDILTHPYQHMLVNHQIEDVSDDEVIVRSKALLPIPGRAILDIEYRDVVVRTPQGWRIKQKSIKRYNQDPGSWAAAQLDIWRSRGARFD
jgi:ketosteroid isomerase-like protein